jgi:hypothetical protein
MSGNLLSAESSLGQLEVQFGWSDWVSITTPRSSGASFAARRLVSVEEDMADLLASFGLPQPEAESLARELWRHRPHSGEGQELGVAFGAAPGRQLLLVAGAVACVLAILFVLATTGLG